MNIKSAVRMLLFSFVFVAPLQAGEITFEGPFTEAKALSAIFGGTYSKETHSLLWTPDEEARKAIPEAGPGVATFQTTTLLSSLLEPAAESIRLHVFATTFPGNAHHGAQPVVGMAEWRETNGSLKCMGFSKFLEPIGEWGNAPSPEILMVGPGKWGVLFEAGSTGQGYTYVGAIILARVGDVFKKVLSFEDFAGNNSGAAEGKKLYEYSSKIEVLESQPASRGFFPLRITTSGTRPGKDGVAEKFGQITSFSFKNDSYFSETSAQTAPANFGEKK